MIRPTSLSFILRLLAAVVLCAVTVGFPVGPVGAQDDDEIQILSTEGADTGTVTMEVAIPPSIGAVEPQPSSFALTVGGDVRPMVVQALEDPVDVVLVLDTSGSMAGGQLEAAQAAATEFVDRMPDNARVAVIGFGSTPRITGQFDTDRAATSAAIASLRARGETALWDALVTSADLIDQGGADRSYVVVLTDGADTVSSSDVELASVRLSDSGAAVYAVTLETEEGDDFGLSQVADAVGGTSFSVDDSSSLEGLYTDIADRLDSRYLVTFNNEAGSSQAVVLAVVADGAIATARTSIGTDAVVVEAQEEEASVLPETLNLDKIPMLGAVVLDDPGWLGHSSALWMGAATVLVALMLLFSMVLIPAVRAQKMGQRMPDLASASSLNQRLSGFADRMINNRDQSGSFDRALDAAGINMRPGELVVMAGTAVLAIGAIVSLVASLGAAILAIIAGALTTWLVVFAKIMRRRRMFAGQLHSTINILVGSLRSGRGLPQAIEMVAQEASTPTSEEFRRVVVETRVGRDPIVSLDAVADRMDNDDLRWISQAIAINRELGGDLIELLENVADTVRDRGRLALQVRSLSAEGRVSGWVMLGLPIVMYAYLWLVNRPYVSLLHETGGGRFALGSGVVAMACGGIWIRQLVNIKY